MWIVQNQTPYAADRRWLQDADGNKVWLVVVKATFDVLPDGTTRLADEQQPVLAAPVHLAEPGASSLAEECDLFGVKATTDVLLRAQACSRNGRLADVIDVGITVGPVKKRLRVFGERRWRRALVGTVTMSAPEPFEAIPIIYENAYGGWDRADDDSRWHRLDVRNPVGTGFAVAADHCVGRRLPNVEHPDRLIGSWKDRPAPAGFGPIECHWTPRRELAGTYDDSWHKERFPLWAKDFDVRYNHCAPADQQAAGFLRGGEPVELINLSPPGRLAFALPRVQLAFQTRFGRRRIDHRGQLATVLIEPDARRVTMSWQAWLVCNREVDNLDATIVSEKRIL